jgi:predicted nucleotidyltransferase
MKNNKALIEKITQRIVSGAQPDKILLFGSFASDSSNNDSDIDLLVIKDSKLRRDERDGEIRKFLKDIIFPMDIFVYTPKEVERFKNLSGSFLKKIFDTGRVVYER